MITCLTDWIGARGIKDGDSGHYVNDLPGMSTASIDMTKSVDDDNLAGCFDRVSQRAIDLFESDIRTYMKRTHKYFGVKENITSGIIKDYNVLDLSSKWNGCQLYTEGYHPNLEITINDINLHLISEGTFTFKIYDTARGQELYTKEVVGVEGMNTIKINKTYRTAKYPYLFICYDASECECTEATYYDSGEYYNQNSVSITKGTSVLTDNLSGDNTGLVVNYSVKCSLEAFVCNRLDDFTQPILYKHGIELLNERIYSDSVNRYTLIDITTAEKLKEMYVKEYDKLIIDALESSGVIIDGECFVCNKAINLRTQLP